MIGRSVFGSGGMGGGGRLVGDQGMDLVSDIVDVGTRSGWRFVWNGAG